MADCQFPLIEYFNYESRCIAKFQCDEEALPGGSFCIFHDENDLQDKNRIDEVIRRLSNKISTSYDKPLVCIGYHIPSLEVTGNFAKSVYFINSNFYGYANFSEVEFSGAAIFDKAKFHGEANFQASIFHGAADFRACDLTN